MSTIRPQYDANGFDSGLWLLFHNDDPVCESLTLFMRDNKLFVGQFPDWDCESYDDECCIDSEHVEIGEFVCPNPFEDDDAAERLYSMLKRNEDKVVWL